MLVGIVGKTNTGKSTFFKASTLAEVAIEGRPFVTIKPNSGVSFVKINCVDKEFHVKCRPKHGYCLGGYRFVPVQLMDVAGLVPGAHKGRGLGNQFLDDLRQADVLIHIIDVSGSTNEGGESVEPLSYDPANDIHFLEVELDMWYLRLIKKGWDSFARKVIQERGEANKAVASHLVGLGVNEKMVEDLLERLGLPEDLAEWDENVLRKLATELRKLTKPMIIACNKIDVKGAAENFARLVNQFPNHILVACSAESELALREAAKHELIEYLPGEGDFRIEDDSTLSNRQRDGLRFVRENVLKKFGNTGVQQVLNDAVFKLLKYISVYPVANQHLKDNDGNILPDCFLVPEGTTALRFAYRVHTDIGNNFIRAVDLKTKQIIGKEHQLRDGQVIEIITSK